MMKHSAIWPAHGRPRKPICGRHGKDCHSCSRTAQAIPVPLIGDRRTGNGIRRLSHAGPFRLTISTSTPASAGRSATRSSAGGGSAALASGRNITNSVSALFAASCKRRRDSWRTCDCQKSSAPHVPARSICSADHNASALVVVLISSRFSGFVAIRALNKMNEGAVYSR
jgi:hypothetical protein